MEQKAARAAVAKALKQRKVVLRKGHWRLPLDGITWYVDLRADGPGPTAPLHFEIGAYVDELGHPEPEGGAVDCPLLQDLPLDTSGGAARVTAAVDSLVDRLLAADTVTALAKAWRAGEYPDALVDRHLRARFEHA